VGAVALATLLPCRGPWATAFGYITNAAIVLLFFLHGSKLSREAIVAGLSHWRLHLLVLVSTYVLFPVLGLAAQAAGKGWVEPSLLSGLLFLTLLPSTVQSSIAFTSVAGGNVAAAVCSASASNLIGIFLTPILVGSLMGAHGGGGSLEAVRTVVLQLLLPFAVGHFSRPITARWLDKRKKLVGIADRTSIILVVYTAFSAAVVEGLWGKLSVADLAAVLVLDAVILAIVLVATTVAARKLGFSKPDEVAIVFCGSKKSLASGVPMAGMLFPAAAVGPMIVPLMLFHQIQLMVCAVLARRYAKATAQSASDTV
jgi:solute carrier family 10 (sodium/bile acid cotransporter), member 7